MSDDRPVKPLTERRQRFAEKQAQQGRGLFADQLPQGTGPLNRHGMPQLPPGQRRVPNWPVLDLGDVPDVTHDEWRLEVDGLVERPLVLTWREFMALPQTDDQSDFHCVTTWSRMDMRFSGVRFADVVREAGPAAERTIRGDHGLRRRPDLR